MQTGVIIQLDERKLFFLSRFHRFHSRHPGLDGELETWKRGRDEMDGEQEVEEGWEAGSGRGYGAGSGGGMRWMGEPIVGDEKVSVRE